MIKEVIAVGAIMLSVIAPMEKRVVKEGEEVSRYIEYSDGSYECYYEGSEQEYINVPEGKEIVKMVGLKINEKVKEKDIGDELCGEYKIVEDIKAGIYTLEVEEGERSIISVCNKEGEVKDYYILEKGETCRILINKKFFHIRKEEEGKRHPSEGYYLVIRGAKVKLK